MYKAADLKIENN